MTSPIRPDELLQTQQSYAVLENVRQEFLGQVESMVESALCVLSYPKLSRELRSRIADIQRLVSQAVDEVNRLQTIHQSAISKYAFDLYGLAPGSVIRPANKPRNRRVVVSHFSIGDDRVLTASGWRVDGLRTKKVRDSVMLVEGLWTIDSGEPILAIPAEELVRPSSPHRKSWGMLVDSTHTGSGEKATVVRNQRETVGEIQNAFNNLTTLVQRFSTDDILQYRESETVGEVFAELEAFPALSRSLTALNALADSIRDDDDWGACWYREAELTNLDLLTALYGIRAGDTLSVRYPHGMEPESWHTIVVSKAWESTKPECKGEMSVMGNRLRKDGTVGKKEDYVVLIPYRVEWRLADPIRAAEARHSKYGDAQWYQPAPIIDYETPIEVLRPAGERFVAFCRGLLFDFGGLFPDGIPITVADAGKRTWNADWAYWEPVEGEGRAQGKGIIVTASHLGYAVGNRQEQAAVLLAAGLHQMVKDGYGWCHEASQRARGIIRAIAAIYPDLGNPYHSSTNQMLPETTAHDAYAQNGYELLGRRFADEDLIRWVVRDVDETFRKNSLVFALDSSALQESSEKGGRSQLVGRTRL
jgi:hypothetical protein